MAYSPNTLEGDNICTKARKKMLRYFGDISCIEGFRHNISEFIVRNSLFLAIYRMVNAGQRKSYALQCTPICLVPRGFEAYLG